MKKSITIILVLFELNLFAQGNESLVNTIPSEEERTKIEEELVRLAWNNYPMNTIVRQNAIIAKDEAKITKFSWLDNFGANFNLNEFNINPEADIYDRSAFYPRYNIYAHLTVGMFINIPLNTKIDNEKVIVAESNLEIQKIATRTEVLKLYNQYVMLLEQLKIQNEIIEDYQSTIGLYEQKFRNGEISYETYNGINSNFNRERINNLKVEQDLREVKIELEGLIGIPLDEVRRNN